MTNISIIVSAYNDEKTVRQCLESIIAQDNADMQMECLVVDDCSTDETLAIIRRVVGSYHGKITFHIYRHKTHHGVSRTRNTGLERAQGDYVMFVNATDLLRADCMDVYTVYMMRYWDADVIAGNVFNVSADRSLFGSMASAMVLRGKGDVLCHEMLRSHLYLNACNKMIRRDLLMSNHVLFDESMAYGDIQWAVMLFSCVSSIALLPDITYDFAPRRAIAISMVEKWVNALLCSYTATCENMLNNAPRPEASDSEYYLYHQLFVYGILSHADKLLEEYSVVSQVKRELSNVRSRLLSQIRSDGQKTLYLYLKQRNTLFSGMVKLPVFKTYGKYIEEVVDMLSAVVAQD